MQDRRIKSYQIVGKLAEGGMGAVYVARHELMNKQVVIKLLHPRFSNDADLVRRFFNEARAATSIQHPGIVEVFDTGYADGQAYIIMERLLGDSLAARINQGGVDVEHAVRIVRQLAGVLAAAHSHQIVHRDLKPENVFIVPDPEVPGGERVKVLDFGIAKLMQDQAGEGVATAAGSMFGTPAYMAPEQCADAAAVDHRADLYAIGCILYELLCGRPPFGHGGLELLAAHLRDQPTRPRALRPRLSQDLDNITLLLLSKQPDRRFQTCDELIHALDKADIGAGLQAPDAGDSMLFGATIPPARSADPASVMGAATAPPLGHSMPAQLAAAAPSHVLAASPSGPQLSPSHGVHSMAPFPTSPDRQRSPKRSRTPMIVVAVLAIAAVAGVAGYMAIPKANSDEPVVEPAPEHTWQAQLDQARKLAAERDWQRAIVEASRVPEDAPEYEDAQAVIENASTELSNRAIVRAFNDALKSGAMRSWIPLYHQVPADSVYQPEAEAAYIAARDQWLTKRLARANKHARKKDCKRLGRIVREVGKLFPESVTKFEDLAATCTVAKKGSTAASTGGSAATPKRDLPMSLLPGEWQPVLRKAEPGLSDCAIHGNIQPGRMISVGVHIGADGTVVRSAALTGRNLRAKTCMKAKLDKLRFPPAKNDTKVWHTFGVQ